MTFRRPDRRNSWLLLGNKQSAKRQTPGPTWCEIDALVPVGPEALSFPPVGASCCIRCCGGHRLVAVRKRRCVCRRRHRRQSSTRIVTPHRCIAVPSWLIDWATQRRTRPMYSTLSTSPLLNGSRKSLFRLWRGETAPTGVRHGWEASVVDVAGVGTPVDHGTLHSRDVPPSSSCVHTRHQLATFVVVVVVVVGFLLSCSVPLGVAVRAAGKRKEELVPHGVTLWLCPRPNTSDIYRRKTTSFCRATTTRKKGKRYTHTHLLWRRHLDVRD